MNSLITALHTRLKDKLEEVSGERFVAVEWLRAGGRCGGGVRFECPPDSTMFAGASVNFSHVHYDDEPERPLRSATALSSIIHPRNPRAPSVHVHISFTEQKDRPGAWRVMADLNPSIVDDGDASRFRDAVTVALGEHAARAIDEGERYFFIPALKRHRGVVHTYLEGYASDDAIADLSLAQRTGEATIDVYADIVRDAATRASNDADRAAQLAYHTVYLFQVLTLDRGTTSGLLVHDENDQGIMGSLPPRIDPALLTTFAATMPEETRPLLDAIVHAVPDGIVDVAARLRLAQVVRSFFRAHPAALSLQAQGSVVPPTVHNHLGR